MHRVKNESKGTFASYMCQYFMKNEGYPITYYHRSGTKMQKSLNKLVKLSYKSSRYAHSEGSAII